MGRITLSDYGRFKIPPPAGTKEKERPSYMDLYCRLASIENILGDEYDLERLCELAQADREGISPCTFCRFNPPSSCDGKPCCMCPAEAALQGEQEEKR